MGLYSFHLFAGGGGGILSDILLGHTPIGAVEIEEYPRKVLLQRQLDGCLPRFPIWDDVKSFRSDNPDTAGYIERLRGISDRLIIAGGFPCQDISCAGKGAGIEGERSGLWSEMSRIVGEVRPNFVFVENSPMLTVRGGTRVINDLTALGYNCRWGIVGADDVGAPHRRKRVWVLAHTNNGTGRTKPKREQEMWPEQSNGLRSIGEAIMAHSDSRRCSLEQHHRSG